MTRTFLADSELGGSYIAKTHFRTSVNEQGRRTIGFDTEFDMRLKHPMVSMSLYNPDNDVCLIIDVRSMKVLPTQVERILQSPGYLKCGVGTNMDAKLILDNFDCPVNNILDAGILARMAGIRTPNLEHLSSEYTNYPLKKANLRLPKNNESFNLKYIRYNVRDSIASYKMYELIQNWLVHGVGTFILSFEDRNEEDKEPKFDYASFRNYLTTFPSFEIDVMRAPDGFLAFSSFPPYERVGNNTKGAKRKLVESIYEHYVKEYEVV